MRFDRKINLSDMVQRAILLQDLSKAKGWHNVEVGPARVKPSQQQHAYYRAVVLPIARDFLNESQGGIGEKELFSDDSAHWWLKSTLRGIPVADPNTGEQVGAPIVKSHADYEKDEMTKYIDDVIELLRRFDVNVPPPDRSYQEQAA